MPASARDPRRGQLQDLAHVGGALARLPALERALVTGRLSWTKTRLLCRVATPEDEARWVAFAEGLTARALAREVRALDLGSIEAGALDPEEDGDGPSDTRCMTVRCSARVNAKFHRVRWLARRMAGEELPSWECMEAAAAEAIATLGFEVEEEECEEALRSEPLALATDAPVPEPSEREAEPPIHRDRVAMEPPIDPCTHPSVLQPLLVGLAEADAFELDARLRRALALEQRVEADAAPLLLHATSLNLHRFLGFASVESWGRERLGLGARKLRALLRLGRASRRSRALHAAFGAGRISWVQAQALVPVLVAVPERTHETEWIERATRITVRRLQEDVDTALVQAGAHPEAFAATGGLPERQTGARPMAADAPPEGQPEGQPESQPESQPRSDEADRFTFVGPADVVRLFKAALCSIRRRIERASGQAATVTARVTEGMAAEWLFDHALAIWTASGGARTRREHAVFARDGWRCTVPGCTSYRNLHDHHVRFRSAGGSDGLANRTTLCAWHHLRGVHQGRVRVTGSAPDGLRFELGIRAADAPLLVYGPGERLLHTPGSAQPC